MSCGLSLNADAPVCWLDEEVLPEMTLLDDTCDSPLPGRMPATPVTAGSMNGRFTSLQLSSSSDYTTAEIPCPQEKTLDLLKSNLSSPKVESKTFNAKPSRQNDTITSETSSSDGAEEDNSEVHNPELSKHNSTTSTDSNDKMFDPSESISYPEQWLDVRYFPEITLLDVTRESELLSSMEATQESIFENSRPSPEHSGSNMAKSQTSAEETSDSHPSNVTTDMSSSSVVSVRCAASLFSTSDIQCNTSSKNVTSELHGEPLVNAVEANYEEPPASYDAELSSKETRPSPKASGSVNGSLTSPQSSSTDSNTPAQIPCPKNTTLDLHPSNESSPKAESEATDQATSVSDNTPETSLVISQNVSAVKATSSSAVRNTTFDRRSLQKTCANTFLGDAGAATSCLQNTFDAEPPRQNGTITLSETSSSDGRQNTFDKSTPLKVCDATSSPKENNSVAPTPEHNGPFSRTDSNTRMVDTPESVSEVNPTVEEASGAGQRDTKDQSQSSLSLTDGLSDTLGHQNMDVENNTSNPFNLDDTRDLRADPLSTSTPMTTCKIFSVNTQREGGKTTAAQKRLYGDGLGKLGGQLPSDVPSNILCDRKTFLTHTAAKSLLPPLRAASKLLRDKTGSAPSGRFDALTSGLPMTRQRAQTAPGAPQTTRTSSSHKLRASTTGSKQPNSGLQRPQLSGVASCIQRAATGLRLPSVRSNASSHGLRGPTATNTLTKTSHAKKHPISRGDSFPGAKRTRIDTLVPSTSTEASVSDAANGAKTVKQSTTSRRALPAKGQKNDAAVLASTAAEMSTSSGAVSRARAPKPPASSHRALLAKAKDCANCLVLEQQLKEKSAEIERLKEELLK
ncbi:uncharacterized protein LOC142951825 isoform X2 [Anarhichas minor]|uniref:uncharacterized protein LOC142951825 isoform X2 n=1 Tax=Anarhichas minor TaxID=65739 RepID=UPI003F734C75